MNFRFARKVAEKSVSCYAADSKEEAMKQKRVRSFRVLVRAILKALREYIQGNQDVDLFSALLEEAQREARKQIATGEAPRPALENAIAHALNTYPQAKDLNAMRSRLRMRILGEWCTEGTPSGRR